MKKLLVSLLSVLMVMYASPLYAAERPETPYSVEATDSNGEDYICHRIEDGEVYVAGMQLGTHGGNVEYYLGDGKGGLTADNASDDNYNVSYDPTTSTITLNEANLTKTAFTDHTVQYDTQTYPQDFSSDAVIISLKDITIKVIGDNTLENKRSTPKKTYTGLHRDGIYVDGNLTIVGEGKYNSSLTSKGLNKNDMEWSDNVGINVIRGNLTIEDVTLTAQGGDATYTSAGISIKNGNCSIINSRVKATSGSVKPNNSATVAYNWTGSYGIIMDANGSSINTKMEINNSDVEALSGSGYYSIGVYSTSVDTKFEVNNNSVLNAIASGDSAISIGIVSNLSINKANVEAESEGAKNIEYTYGGVTYTGYVYSYGYSGYTYDNSNNLLKYKINVQQGSVCFKSGICKDGEYKYSAALDGYIDRLDYSSDLYAKAKYGEILDSSDIKEWTEDCEAADKDNGLVLKNNYRYFEITHEHNPSGVIEWVGDTKDDRPKSVEISLKNGQITSDNVTVTPDVNDKWSFSFSKQPVYNCQVSNNYLADNAWGLIDYSLEVEELTNYEGGITGFAFEPNGFLITETYNGDNTGDNTGSTTKPSRPSSPSKDLPSNTEECQKEFGKDYIYSKDLDACIIKYLVVDTSTK